MIEVGDTVRIHPKLDDIEFVRNISDPNPGVTRNMMRLAGKEVVIKKIQNQGTKYEVYKIEGRGFAWSREMFQASRIKIE